MNRTWRHDKGFDTLVVTRAAVPFCVRTMQDRAYGATVITVLSQRISWQGSSG